MMNVEEAVFKNVGEAGVGVIIRDSQGHVVAAQSKKIHFPLGAIEAKALAMESGILFALDLGMAEVILESDSWNVVKAVRRESFPPSSISGVISGIQRRIPGFRIFETSHVKRKGNVPSHLLAQHAKSLK